jgi:hypothetical protein
MKLTYSIFTTIEVIVLFVVGTLGRRLLEYGLSYLHLADLLNSIIRILFVLLIIGLAVLAHNRISRYLIGRGILIEEGKK